MRNRELLERKRSRFVRTITMPSTPHDDADSLRRIWQAGAGVAAAGRQVEPAWHGGDMLNWSEKDFSDIRRRLSDLEDERQGMLSGRIVQREEVNRFLVYFDSQDWEVRGQRDVLDRAVRAIGAAGAREIVVVGHTDRHGTPRSNAELGDVRAVSVKRELVHRGVPDFRIECRSEGNRQPRLSADPDGDEADIMNRRGEIIFKS